MQVLTRSSLNNIWNQKKRNTPGKCMLSSVSSDISKYCGHLYWLVIQVYTWGLIGLRNPVVSRSRTLLWFWYKCVFFRQASLKESINERFLKISICEQDLSVIVICCQAIVNSSKNVTSSAFLEYEYCLQHVFGSNLNIKLKENLESVSFAGAFKL